MHTIDRVKVSKVESILAALNPAEQHHIGTFVAKLLNTAPPVPAVPLHGTVVTPATVAATVANQPLSRLNMHAQLRRGMLVDFIHPKQRRTIQCRVKTINSKTVSVYPVAPEAGDPEWWNVSPSLLRKVTAAPAAPAPAPAAPTGTGGVPSAPGAGDW